MPIIIHTGATGGGGGSGGSDALTFLELQDEVLAFGFDATTYRSRVKRWLNEGLHRIQRQVKMPQLADLVTVAGEDAVDIPSDAIRIHSIGDTTGRYTLDEFSPDEWDVEAVSPPGKPSGWMVYNGRLYLVPTPDQAYTFQIRYSMNSLDMVNDNDTFVAMGLPAALNDYAMLVVDWALFRAYAAEDDEERSMFHRSQFTTDLLALKGDLQKPSDYKRIIGGKAVTAGPRFRMPGR